MKAVIMAGGEGTRLRPLSLGAPKPMTPLLDQPVMGYIISLLRRHGICDIAVTLRYMPQTVTGYFGDGSAWGVRLTYFVEDEPLGTAGSVKNCMEFLGQDDFLVISGDAVCDLNLSDAIRFHRQHAGVATLVLYRHPAPLEYGLVVAGRDGNIERFIEKPGWGQVICDTVNTGIYLLSRRAMDAVPVGRAYDFAKDLFPALLARGETLCGMVAEGYWCDMGDCNAYLNCVADVLAGKVKLELSARQMEPGVWCAGERPAGVQIVPPCYLGSGVAVGKGSRIGPYTVLGAGSTVGKNTLVSHSVFQGAAAGSRATVYGAILCRGARVGDGAVLNEGTVLGEDAAVGKDAVLMENVKLWPRRAAPDGGRLNASLTVGGIRGALKFADGGVLRGEIGVELTAETLLLLGGALGEKKTIGLGCCGGDGARMLARAAECGAASAGAKVLMHDAPCPSAAAWLAQTWSLPVSLYVEQEGERAFLHLFDERGLVLSPGEQRKLEHVMLLGEQQRVPALRIGAREEVSGVEAAYAQAAARNVGQEPVRGQAAVTGRSAADRALAETLSQLGWNVEREWREGIPAFWTGRGGFWLYGRDEAGSLLLPERMLSLAALIGWKNGVETTAVPAAAPAVMEGAAVNFGARVLRLGRDGAEAERCYAAQLWMRDALFAAGHICTYLARTGESLYRLGRSLPAFTLRRREVSLRGGRGAVMQAMARAFPDFESTGEGVRIRETEGWVCLTPLTRRQVLRVVSEAASAELAEELCGFYADQIARMDRQMAEQQREK